MSFLRTLAGCLAAAAIAGCSGSSPAKLTAVDSSAARRESGVMSDAAPEARPARCCVVPSFGPSSPYQGCNLLTLIPDASVDLIQACWDGDGGAGYGRWQCGGPLGQAGWCTDGGLSCAIGDLCWLTIGDSAAGGCLGTVQDCSYPWRD